MNPAEAERALEGWLDAVPFTKIFGFGSDTGLPGVWWAMPCGPDRHCQRLERRVLSGIYSEADAREVADHLMLLNGEPFSGCRARRRYRLKSCATKQRPQQHKEDRHTLWPARRA